MALIEDVVATTGVVLASEKVVVADFIECCRRGIGGNVAPDTDAGALSAVHRNGGVPSNPGAIATLNVFIPGELGFVFRGNGVEVIRGGDHGHTQVELLGALEQAEHDFSPALMTRLGDNRIEGLIPLGGFLGVRVHVMERIGILVVDSHPDLFLCVVDRDMSYSRDRQEQQCDLV